MTSTDARAWEKVLQALSDEYHSIEPGNVDAADFAKRAEASGAPENALAAFGSGLATYTLNPRTPEPAPSFERLIALLPELEARTGGWMSVYEIVHEDGIIPSGFAWPGWMTKGRRYLKPGGVEAADLETCRRLLTVLARQERFSEGSLRGSIEDGLVVRIVRRIAELAPTA